MKSKKIIGIYYILFSVYLLLLFMISNFSILNLLLSLSSLLLLFISYNLGYNYKTKLKVNNEEENFLISNIIFSRKVFLFVFLTLSSFAYIKFYTGKFPLDVLNSYMRNLSVYNEYQQYFMLNNLGTFTIGKVPYILLGLIIKFATFRILIEISFPETKLNVKNLINYILFSLPYLYIGLGRGTSFEIFEIALILIYVVFKRIKNFNFKLLFNLSLISMIGVNLFIMLVDARKFVYNYGKLDSGIYYDSSKFLNNIFPNLTKILYRLYGYFGFGFYYSANYLEHIVISNRFGIIKNIIPKSTDIFYGVTVNTMMDEFVDIGVRWRPDFVEYFNSFGFVLFFVLVGVLGWISSSIEKDNTTIRYELLNFFIILQMFSMLIGNFVATSSSSKIILLFLITILIKDSIK